MIPRHVGRPIAIASLILVAATFAGTATATDSGQTEQPETVVVTLHAKTGSEAALAGVIARHWDTARRLHLVLDTPHLTVRGTEADSKTYFVDIFTWRD